jgi:antitoxin component YwqK of YwqJK toxin-antitoxin module
MIVRQIQILLFICFASFYAFSQVDSVTVQWTAHSFQDICDGKGKKCSYLLDGKIVSKTEYDKERAEHDKFGNCKPCWLRWKDQSGKLVYEGDFLTDCCIGAYISYYDDGKIKIKGHYKIPPKEILDKDIYDMGYCRADGEWIYYKTNGDIEKKVMYKDGKIIE